MNFYFGLSDLEILGFELKMFRRIKGMSRKSFGIFGWDLGRDWTAGVVGFYDRVVLHGSFPRNRVPSQSPLPKNGFVSWRPFPGNGVRITEAIPME